MRRRGGARSGRAGAPPSRRARPRTPRRRGPRPRSTLDPRRRPVPHPPTGDEAPLVTVTGPLAEAEGGGALHLPETAASRDGVDPLSEHVLLHARYGGDAGARNLLLTIGARLTGYGHLDPAGQAGTHQGPAAEMVVHPDYRRRGFGLTLVRALLAEAAPDPLRVWAHGDLPAARALAARAGFARIRSLWTMRRPLTDPPPG